MRGRLRGLGAGGVQARTFHAAALRQLRYFWPHVHGTELPTLTESKIPMVRDALRGLRIRGDIAVWRDLSSEIEWAKVSNVRPDDYPAIAEARNRSVAGLDPDTVARVLSGYEEVKREQGRMDMEDVLLLTAGMLLEDERVAAQVRRQYKFFVVDEFQDVSPLQSALLDLWLGGRDEICVVGDPAQTIYSFAGANADYLRDFPAKHPGTTSIELVRNYRSTPQVVARGQHPAGRHPEQRASGCAGPARPTDRRSPTTVTPTRSPRRPPSPARAVALRDSGRPLSEMAVLFRINAQSEAYEEALTDAGVPYVIRGAARFFDRPEVREAVTRLRGSARSGAQPADGDTWVDLVRDTLAGMGWTSTPPEAARTDPRPLGVLAGTGQPGRGLRARRGAGRLRDRRRSTPSSTTSTAAPPSSTPRWPRASRWRRSTPPRGWSGTRCSSSGSRTARCRSPTRRRLPRSRRSAACSTSG